MTKLRSLSTSNLTSAGGPEDDPKQSVLKGILKILQRKVTEEAETSVDTETTKSDDVAVAPKRLFNNKTVKRRKKNFDYTLFKAPKRFNIKKNKAAKEEVADDK